MIDIARLDKLLQVVGDVRALIVPARLEFAGRQLGVADIEQQQGLNRIDFRCAGPLKIVLDDIEQPAVQAFDQGQGFQIAVLDLLSPSFNPSRA